MGFTNKIKKFKEYSINSLIYNTYYHKKIDEKLVYIESRDGNDFTGNMLRIVEELSTGDYGDFKIVVYSKNNLESKIKSLQKNYNLKIHKIINKEYLATVYMEKAKYIFSDSGLRQKFVKRPEQIVVDTWHGTPLKTMGIDNESEEHRCANIQQVFFACDYLVYPNDYMKERMLNSYMMEKIYPGTILLEGYPRNSVFFDENKGLELKNKLGFENKEVIAYMPTFKGLLFKRKDKKQKEDVYNYLIELDKKLNDDQVLLVKLHVYNRQQIDFGNFKHIQAFPEGYEIYDVLNMTSCLITDYSSVFFDYANTKRKIIIFNYDEEEFLQDRGTYFPISDLPFPKVQNVDDLIKEINSGKNYDDTEFLEKFCTYDNPDAVKNLCRHIFNNENVCTEEKITTDKKNLLIFAGGLKNNGLTSSLISVLSRLDQDKYNIFLSYRSWDPAIKREHVSMFKRIPEGIEFTPLRTKVHPTIREHVKFDKFFEGSTKDMPSEVYNLFEREFTRSYNNFPIDSVIQFNGYGAEESLLLSIPDVRKSIWVHNDMVREIKYKQNHNAAALKYCYNDYDSVVSVSPDLIPAIETLKDNDADDNIRVVHNIINYETIEEKSNDEIKLDDNTRIITSNEEGIEGVLNSDGKKFITIGRFSQEKGHKRLIKAFNFFCEDYPDTQLIIIGGYGRYYKETKKLIENSKFRDNITLIKSISNPMPILKRCDLFIVSSFYEGWPMVIMEADVLKVPVLATTITGTQWMKNYNGYLVDNKGKCILQGMYDFMDGKIDKTLDIDYEQYNEEAFDEFLDII